MYTAEGGKAKARVLLIESDPWDAGLVQEALDELEERPHQNLLGRPVDLYHAATMSEASEAIASSSFDLIVLDLAISGPPALLPFLHLREHAPVTPFVILAGSGEETLALAAMREGAAGYLLKEDVDCLPLARALRCALERQHAIRGRLAMPWVDDLTGLTSRAGFLYQGDMALRLAHRWGVPVRLSRVRLTRYARMQDAFGAQARDLALLESSEMMRDLFPAADLVARVGPEEFAALSIGAAGAPHDLTYRIAAWEARRTGRSADVPVLEYASMEHKADAAESSLEDLLRLPWAQAAVMQK
jgi:PleD family two-component response regulator